MAVNQRVRPPKSKFWTGARVSFCSLFFACCVFVFISGGRVAYGVFWVMALVLPLSLLYAAVACLQMAAGMGLSHRSVLRRQTVLLEWTLRNRGPLALWWITLHMAESRDIMTDERIQTLSLLPFEKRRMGRHITPRHRGVYSLGIDKLVVGDLFNLVHLPLPRPAPLTLVVYPRVPEIPPEWKKRLEPLSLGTLSALSSDEPSVDARPYRYGDSMRRIHWNLTVQKMELMSRLCENQLEQKLVCVLDLSPVTDDRPLDREDKLIESCLSAVRYACHRQIDTTLVYGEEHEVVAHSGSTMGFFDRAHEIMTRVPFASKVSPEELFSRTRGARFVMYFSAGLPSQAVMDLLPRDCGIQICVVCTRRDLTASWASDTGRVRFTPLDIEDGEDAP